MFKTCGRWGSTHERDRGQDIEKERETEGTERRQGKTRWQRSERAESNWVQSGGGTGSLRVGLCLPILMFIWYVSSLCYVLRSSLAEQNLTLSLFRHLSLSYLLSDHSVSYSFCNSHALCSPTLRQFFKTLLFLLRRLSHLVFRLESTVLQTCWTYLTIYFIAVSLNNVI